MYSIELFFIFISFREKYDTFLLQLTKIQTVIYM